MLELALVALGGVVGAAGGWVLARARAAARAAGESQALQSRLAVAESLGDELRKQLTQRDLDLADARQSIEAERSARVQSEVRGEALRESLDEQRRSLTEARERLAETFKALSADVLRESGAALVEQARQTIDAQFGRRQEAIDGLVKPLQQALDRYETELRAVEAKREHAYGSLEAELRALRTMSGELQRQTDTLVTALRNPQVRGRWGELTLRRVVELAGMVEHCDFDEQVTAVSDGRRLRPDMVVRFPGGRQIVVDAKVPLSAYLDAVGAAGAEERRAALVRHAQQIRQHMAALAAKGYWEEFSGTAEFVVMFVPGESFLSAAVEVDPSLIEDGFGRRVVVASPTNLIALLHAGAYGWRQERVIENAARISELGRDLYDRVRTLGKHFDELGKSLARATAAFNRAVGSMESRVFPSARKFRELGAATGDEIPSLEPVDQQPRELDVPELPRQLDAPELSA
jgi:DNA recombination protein RmuC